MQKQSKENGNFLMFKNIKITLTLVDTITYILKHVRLQVPFDKGKLWKFCTANLHLSLVALM